jgi:alkylation response protein AidB-like acyl-CoA dehydrogenase
VDFAFSPEQDQLRAGARDWLASSYPFDRIASMADSEPGWDPASWKQIVDFGWLEPDLLSLVDLAIVFEETGRGLYAGPLLSTVAALPLLASPERDAAAAGDLKAAVAWSAAGLTVAKDGTVTGEVKHVPDLALVDLVVLSLGGGRWASVRTDAAGVSVTPRATTDRTRRMGDLTLDGAAVTELDVAEAAGRDAAMRHQVLLTCESVGTAQRALEITKDYVSERQQFGRVIGTYQAISHRVADIYTRTELSRSLAYWAAVAVDSGSIDAEDSVHAAKAFAGEGAVKSLEEAIQAHGGIGFTWDHILHRFYKRARGNAAAGGRADEHRAALAEAIFA